MLPEYPVSGNSSGNSNQVTRYVLSLKFSFLWSLVLTFPSDLNSTSEVEQDPKRPAMSTLGKPIGVPRCAASISRAFRVSAVETPAKKKRKNGSGSGSGSSGSITQVVELESEGENISDIDFLFSDDENTSAMGKGKSKEKLVTL